jgi:hypothetical protein
MELKPMMKQQLKSMVTQYKSRVSIMSLQKVQTDAVVEIMLDHQNAVVINVLGIAALFLMFEKIARKLVVIAQVHSKYL